MKIAEAAAKSGLSADTIRYYEKSGMLPLIERSSDGYRCFKPSDIEWITLLFWLRETGMPLKQMRRFTRLAKLGGNTKSKRRQMLLDHAAELKRRRAMLDRCEDVLAIKIASYGKDQ